MHVFTFVKKNLQAARRFGLKLSTAKGIFKLFKNEKRIGKKSIDLLNLQNLQDSNQSQTDSSYLSQMRNSCEEITKQQRNLKTQILNLLKGIQKENNYIKITQENYQTLNQLLDQTFQTNEFSLQELTLLNQKPKLDNNNKLISIRQSSKRNQSLILKSEQNENQDYHYQNFFYDQNELVYLNGQQQDFSDTINIQYQSQYKEDEDNQYQ